MFVQGVLFWSYIKSICTQILTQEIHIQSKFGYIDCTLILWPMYANLLLETTCVCNHATAHIALQLQHSHPTVTYLTNCVRTGIYSWLGCTCFQYSKIVPADNPTVHHTIQNVDTFPRGKHENQFDSIESHSTLVCFPPAHIRTYSIITFSNWITSIYRLCGWPTRTEGRTSSLLTKAAQYKHQQTPAHKSNRQIGPVRHNNMCINHKRLQTPRDVCGFCESTGNRMNRNERWRWVHIVTKVNNIITL